MPSLVIAGLGWGDEGKGKIIDFLSEKAEIIIRGQGGHNAGHTVFLQDREYHFHLVPSGILHSHTICLIGAGVALEPDAIIKEIKKLEFEGIKIKNRLFISPYSQIIFSFHEELDQFQEKSKGKKKIGTTGRGIGPSYADRVNRIGIRVGELLHLDSLKKRIDDLVLSKNEDLQSKDLRKISPEKIFGKCKQWSRFLYPYIKSFESDVYKWVKQNRPILIEGAQGALLDNTFGTYPFVTSSSTIAAGIVAGAGMGMKNCKVLGVLKAFATRVGEGPFPTEILDKEEFFPRKKIREIGTTTGRKRRVGWFDAVLSRYAVELNGAEFLALTKLDILDAFDEIYVCHSYLCKGKRIFHPPVSPEDWENIEPVYEKLEGWKSATENIDTWDQLPENCKKYVIHIEELLDVPIGILSFGPKRNQIILRGDMKKWFL
ncbi:MAG: adenylosuccinate synthase [Simkaniaceae bacterium]